MRGETEGPFLTQCRSSDRRACAVPLGPLAFIASERSGATGHKKRLECGFLGDLFSHRRNDNRGLQVGQ